MTANAAELIKEMVDHQISVGEVVAGCNGPHQHKETAVRNACHWAVSSLNCFRWYNDKKYSDYAQSLLDDILAAHASTGHVTFHLRDQPGKDRCNGLIGQAWVLEALLEAYDVIGDNRYLKSAIKLFSAHEFSFEQNLWKITEIDGSTQGFDPTFNHQLWFAYSIMPLVDVYPPASKQFHSFMVGLSDNLTIMRNGLIFHPIDRSTQTVPNFYFKSAKWFKSRFFSPSHLRRALMKDPDFERLLYVSLGYQLFNLVAFVEMYDHLPRDVRRGLKKAVCLVEERDFWEKLDENKYSYPYNAPGFELPIVFDRLPKSVSEETMISAWQRQIEKTFDAGSFSFKRGTPDAACLTARIYELSRCKMSTLQRLTLDQVSM